MEGAMRSRAEEGGKEIAGAGAMTDVLGTGTRAWRAEKPSGRTRAGDVDYQALGDQVLHSARSLGLGVGRKHERRNDRPAPRWGLESLVTWGCYAAWILFAVALFRIGWHLALKLF